MKTFKLISLDLIEENNEEIVINNIPLLDGLIIDREDDKNQWVLESLLRREYYNYFGKLMKDRDTIMVQAKITKEGNMPATFMCSVIGVNEISDHINVIFLGTLINRKKGQIEQILKSLIEEGYQGEELLNAFKNRV